MYVIAAIPSRLLFVVSLAAIFFISSCTTVRNYPVDRPFVYESTVEIEGQFKTDERKTLVNQMEQQLHDSVRARKVQRWVFWKRLSNPPVFDSLNIGKSESYMRAMLNSLGYFRDTMRHEVRIENSGDQKRTFINFIVTPGKQTKLDSVWYSLRRDSASNRPGNDTLQAITERFNNDKLLKKGEPFSKPLIANERDRLADLFRNNGFLRFTSEEILAIWDTVGIELIRPTFDPAEQFELIQAQRRRRQNPTADVEIRLRSAEDTSHLIRYYNGNVTIYPDVGPDTARYVPQHFKVGDYNVITYFNQYKPKVFAENIFIRKGALYRQRTYLRTLNRLNSLDAWALVTIDQVPREGTDTVDFIVKLTPADKYNFTTNLEGSKNIGTSFYEGNLIGLGVNLTLVNRNFAHAANQSTYNLRFGTELGSSDDEKLLSAQSLQAIFNHTTVFPRLVRPYEGIVKRLAPNLVDNGRTIFSFNLGNIERIKFFNVTTLNSSLGVELNWRNNLLGVRLPNIEYNFLNPGEDLEELIAKNASYRYIFNNGFVISSIANFSKADITKTHSSLKRISGEISGLFAGMIKNNSFLDSNLYRFAKIDAEYRRTKFIRRSAFAWRVFGGVGIGIPRSRMDTQNFYLPFFRQYYAGGANSMRAWQLRKLGPGSRVASFDKTIAPDRFGDMQLEANAEYRFYLGNFNGIIFNSALFTDIGNVWFLRDDPSMENEQFSVKRLWQDIAIGVGTGLRIDLGFIKLRFDYAYKLKNPSLEPAMDPMRPPKQWAYNWKPFNGQLQFGVDYPF
jgi:outer membrane protein assembly factor BamA